MSLSCWHKRVSTENTSPRTAYISLEVLQVDENKELWTEQKKLCTVCSLSGKRTCLEIISIAATRTISFAVKWKYLVYISFPADRSYFFLSVSIVRRVSAKIPLFIARKPRISFRNAFMSVNALHIEWTVLWVFALQTGKSSRVESQGKFRSEKSELEFPIAISPRKVFPIFLQRRITSNKAREIPIGIIEHAKSNQKLNKTLETKIMTNHVE